MQLTCNDKEIYLYTQEAKLLKYFIANKNILLSHMSIEQHIWNEPINNPVTRNALISKLRKKLKNRFITTISKKGYIFKL
jgi:DNA-binding response OmpR family regulator